MLRSGRDHSLLLCYLSHYSFGDPCLYCDLSPGDIGSIKFWQVAMNVPFTQCNSLLFFYLPLHLVILACILICPLVSWVVLFNVGKWPWLFPLFSTPSLFFLKYPSSFGDPRFCCDLLHGCIIKLFTVAQLPVNYFVDVWFSSYHQ